MLIREETDGDHQGIRVVNRLAFGRDSEFELVCNLRSAQLVIVSLVALDESEVIGHIVFSRLAVEIDGRTVNAASLAPVAVIPGRQGQGVGSLLITEGLAVLRKKLVEAVIVLGHTAYYPRFGFSPDLTRKLLSPFRGKPEFMGLELVPGSLAGEKGCIRYPAAFGIENS